MPQMLKTPSGFVSVGDSYKRKFIEVRITLDPRIYSGRDESRQFHSNDAEMDDITDDTSSDTQSKNPNVKIIKGLATTVNITKAGYHVGNSAQITISNILQDDILPITLLTNNPRETFQHRVDIFAGDEDDIARGDSAGNELSNTSGKTTRQLEQEILDKTGITPGLEKVFSGDIRKAYAEYSNEPDLKFHIDAITMYYVRNEILPDWSYKDEIPVKDIFNRIAVCAQAVLLIDESITETVKNITLTGSVVSKAHQLADQLKLDYNFDDDCLWVGREREYRKESGLVIPIISPDNGLMGYPTLDNKYINVKVLYNSIFKFRGPFKVQSAVPGTNGTYKILRMSHVLESMIPNGKWETNLTGLIPESKDNEAKAVK